MNVGDVTAVRDAELDERVGELTRRERRELRELCRRRRRHGALKLS